MRPGLANTDSHFPLLPASSTGRAQNPKKVTFGTTTLEPTTTTQQAANNTMVTTSTGQIVDFGTFLGDRVDSKLAARDAASQDMDKKIISITLDF